MFYHEVDSGVVKIAFCVTTHTHRNGTLDRGLDTKHGVLEDDKSSRSSPVLYFDSNFFLS